uniref:Si:dkey-33c12.4 n=1 Tax=Astyanax mexicanus TaxID=7994 RepID=A0A8B9HMP2_ASTMX
KNAKELVDEEEKLKMKAEKKKQKKMELDMNSCFVTNAAAIAKRKIEQKPKPDRKDKKEENLRKHGAIKTSTKEPHNQTHEEKESSGETVDFVTKSLVLATMGNDYAAAGNLEMAVMYFTDAIKHNPKEFKLFGNRSFCYEKMQQYERALADADIALSLSPTWIKGLYRKGKALVGLKRYYDASLIYKEVLKLDSSCTDAAQELMRVQIMQLMDMGFTREQSSNALIIHGTVEKALEALSGSIVASPVTAEEEWEFAERKQPSKVPLRTVSQNQPRPNTAVMPTPPELFPIWVGDLVPEISESEIYELFRVFGPVYSVKVLRARRCAFVNFTSKDHSEKAIREMHGYAVAGTTLVVRYPDRLHSHLGASKAAATDTAKVNKLPDECYFWRTTGCIKNNRCSYRHVPEHKGVDRAKAKF